MCNFVTHDITNLEKKTQKNISNILTIYQITLPKRAYNFHNWGSLFGHS